MNFSQSCFWEKTYLPLGRIANKSNLGKTSRGWSMSE
jgi:hypothetical protein